MKILSFGDLSYVHNRRWARGLAETGIHVSVCSKTIASITGVEILSGAVPPFRPWRPVRWLRRWRAHFRRVLNKAKPDLVHVPFPGPYSVPLEDLGKTPMVVQTWGAEVIPMDQESEADRLRKVALFQRADRILASSNCLAEATVKYAGLDRARVQTIYWGVDLDQFSPPHRPTQDLLIGFVKGMTPKYGLEFLIQAMPRVLRELPTARMVVLCDGPGKTRFRANAQQLGVDDAILWNGAVSHERMPEHFSRMAISVMPSTHASETLGVAGIESQAMRVPVVASRIGGLPESIRDGETGTLVPPQDPDALADAMIDLLKNHDKRIQFGRQGRTFVEGNFDWRKTLEETVEVFREML
jgi:L-malate glycosyltransferase